MGRPFLLLVLLMAFVLKVPSLADDATPSPQEPTDTRGPIRNVGMRVVAQPDGVQAPDYIFHGADPKAVTWTGKWIHSAQSPPDTTWSQAILFRKEIDLAAAPDSVQAWIAADNYRLYVNGQLASRGPADPGRDYDGTPSGHRFYDSRDLTPFFHAGKNAVAVEVFGGPGLLFQAHFQTTAGDQVLASDGDWRDTPCPYLQNAPAVAGDQMGSDSTPTFDANREPIGWQSPGFDDSGWLRAQVVSAPPEVMVASEISPLMEIAYPNRKIVGASGALTIPDHPLENGHDIVATGDASFDVHFDRIMAAHWGIKVRGGRGARIYLEASERGGQPVRWGVVLRDGLQFFESPNYYSVGRIHVTLRHVTTPVEIMDVNATYRSQPIAYAGSFSCSDEKLNRIWETCRWVTQINLQTHHLDSPQHQEPISDYGDYLIEDLVTYNAFGRDAWLARQDLRKWSWIMGKAHYRTFHTSYALLWLQALLNYADYTGDQALVVELAPSVHKLLDQFTGYIGSNGIVSNAPNYLFMDWVTIDGFPGHHPPAVIGQGYMTAFFYRALADGQRVAELTGDPARAAHYEQLRAQIRAAYNRELWDEKEGLYRDGRPFVTTTPPSQWLPADTNIETFSVQNNALAVLYDLAPPERQPAIIRKMMATTPWNVRPYFMHFVLSAVAHAGLFDAYGTEWLRKWKIVPETHSFFEMGDSGDLSHAWIATPLYQLDTQVLGITPAAPGFDRVAIRPSLGDLAFARGVVPTPHGNVGMDWSRKADQLEMRVTVPVGTQADLALPLGDAKTPALLANGAPLWRGETLQQGATGITAIQRRPTALEMTLAPGQYQFRASGLPMYVDPAALNRHVTSDGPLVITTLADDASTLENDIPAADLLAPGSPALRSVKETGEQPNGNGTNPDAIHNGTILNGQGGVETLDDGATYRGYGNGSSLIFYLNNTDHPAGYDLTGIRTFACHADRRTSQSYVVSLAFATAPLAFVPLASASVTGDDTATEIRLEGQNGAVLENGQGVKAANVVALKFNFKDGPLGFNVYREISLVGQPSK